MGKEGAHPLTKSGAVKIEEVEAGGWADIARLVVGDVIVEVDHTPTPTVAEFEEFVEARVTLRSSSIVFLIVRGQESRFVVVEPTWSAR